MSNFQKELNIKALEHLSTLSKIRMDKKNHSQYLEEIGHSRYYGLAREIPVELDIGAKGIEFDLDLARQKSPIFKRNNATKFLNNGTN